jgi:hypothetical protein
MMSKFNPPIGEPPAVQFFAPDRLTIDGSYQRDTHGLRSRRLIEDIAKDWDWRLCTPLLVAARDGGLYIIDGQHRWQAAKMRGDIPFLPCAVGNYTGSAEEAALFVAANRHRVRVNPLDMWRAAVTSGDEATVKLDRLVTNAGLSIGTTPNHYQLKPGELLCTKALYTGLRLYGEERVAAALIMIGGAFADQVITHSGLLFAAVLGFFARPGEISVDQLEEALAAMSADEWTTHPALGGIIGASARAAKLRDVIIEVASMCGEEEAA